MTPWFWSAGSESEKENSKCFLLLLMPLGITSLIWKEATHLLIAYKTFNHKDRKKVLESRIIYEFFNSETERCSRHYLSNAAQ